MRKIIIHSVPIVISFVWLILVNHTLNPITLRGPYFLQFYLILLMGFYMSILGLKTLREKISKTTAWIMISIFLLGVIKLGRGIILDKPVGFLILILILELIVLLLFSL